MDTDILKNQWWGELKHGGMLISSALINQYYNSKKLISSYKYELFRDKYINFKAKMEVKKERLFIAEWVDFIFEEVLEYKINNIQKGNNVNSEFKIKTLLGRRLSPDRVIFDGERPVFFIKFCEDKNIGVGKGKKSSAEFFELLRENKDVSLGVITNGEQIRLCHVGSGHESWVEWTIENWFVEQEFRNQLYGFMTILSKDSTYIISNEKSTLITAIEESRSKQGELSSVLGEQVREAVEILISTYEETIKSNSNLILEETFNNKKKYLDAIYQSASRVMMRMVVLFFAESRGMLPRDIQSYNDSYGLEGLYSQLKIASTHEGKKALKNQYSGWRRILSLFKLVYKGSGHQLIQLQAYGGELFKSGDLDSKDDITKVLAIFESEQYKLSDFDVLNILEKLKIGKIKVKEGNKFIWVNGPVDFSDIRTEYIGIMYEGLLDYSLNRANEPMLVLNAGDQPVLPLSHLEVLNDDEIKQLFKEFKSEIAQSDQIIDNVKKNENTETEEKEESLVIQKVKAWALRVIVSLNLVKKNKSMDEYEYKKICEREAEKLIIHIYETGDYFLVKAGGTRKGTGTYYTKPGLTIPTVKRTLEPLLYYVKEDNIVPKEPEHILSLKICDPACGSGSFLVAATEYISDVLTESMLFYGRFEKKSIDKTRIMPYATRSKGLVEEETLSVPPESEYFEEHLRARLMRYVVERCIYGVDINPMAVELARLSLWIDTMNDELPFTFLDHKIKHGNALVGASFSNFMHYPIQAWKRDGGDSDHSNGIKYSKKEWTNKVKDFFNNVIKPEMVEVIEEFQGIKQLTLESQEEKVEKLLQENFNEVTELLEEFHNIPMSANGIRKRELMYRDKIIENEAITRIKFAFDKWCSIWFWPGDKLDFCPSPKTFSNMRNETVDMILNISKEQSFFHWELEFPDVFASKNSGFSAIIGNPPWNIAKPNSVEFFSYYDPLYRTYDKQVALKKQKQLFEESSEIERRWLIENANNKAMSNWVQYSASPFGYDNNGDTLLSIVKSKKQNETLHKAWKLRRNFDKLYDRGQTPYLLQGGSDINLYKLFIEQGLYLLSKNGRLGLIVPSGIYSDKGTFDLRRYFLSKTKWEWLFSFENREKIFDIHGSFKFAVIILNKGLETEYIKTAFMIRKLSTWEKLNVPILMYSKDNVTNFSPDNIALLEFEDQNDLDIIGKIFVNGINVDLSTTREFDMTNDSKLFVKQSELLDKGYCLDEFGIMRKKQSDNYYPLYQGTAVNQLNFADKKWDVSVNDWTKNKISNDISMQYYLNEKYSSLLVGIKLYYRSIARNTDTRTFLGTVTPFFPSGNSLNKIIIGHNSLDYIRLSGILSTFAYDYILRNKMIGTNVNSFILKEIPIIKVDANIQNYLILVSSRLQLTHKVFSPQWLEVRKAIKYIKNVNLYSLWAITIHERRRLRCILDALVAYYYGLNFEDFNYILRDDENNAKGFWRVDKEKPKEVKQTTLTLLAFNDLLERGIADFIANEWQLPSYAAEYYGEQYLSWQLDKHPEESWKECEEHAKAFLGDELYEELTEKLMNK